MRTEFATPDRASAQLLEQQISLVSTHPVICEILKAVNGMFVVCNEFRQILTANTEMLKLLNSKDGSEVLGLRPGEALSCIHAHRCEGGCGTSNYCKTCGAVLAMLSSLENHQPAEKICAITVNSIRERQDFYFKVKSSPIKIADHSYLLLTLQNITDLQKLQALEKAFMHDITNTAFAISGLSKFALESDEDELPLLVKSISKTASRMLNEIKLHSLLLANDSASYDLVKTEVSLTEILEEIVDTISGHPATRGKKLRKPEILPDKIFHTDKTLILKVLQNMLINAFEATDTGRAVRFWLDCGKKDLTFCVWNHKPIPESMRGRIFQRNYTTKTGNGHGLGTYSMKFFGETLLGGEVSYESSETKGTVFRLVIPL
jgi:hypothetical protein